MANNIHPDTVNWGFGVACNGNNAPVLAGNMIRRHWYGVAAINGGRPNLGNLGNSSPDDDGGNHITENGLGGQIYGFYNNTPLPQMAQGNWWGGATAQEVEDAIWHQVDDPSLGLVDYSPVADGRCGRGGETGCFRWRLRSVFGAGAPQPRRSAECDRVYGSCARRGVVRASFWT